MSHWKGFMRILHLAKNMSVKLLLPPYFLKKLLYKVVDYPYCFRFCGLLLIAKRSRTGVPSRWNSIAAEPPAFGHTMTSSFWKPKVETIWFPFSFPAQGCKATQRIFHPSIKLSTNTHGTKILSGICSVILMIVEVMWGAQIREQIYGPKIS